MEITYKSFAIELSEATVNWLKLHYNLQTNAEVRQWLQLLVGFQIQLYVDEGGGLNR